MANFAVHAAADSLSNAKPKMSINNLSFYYGDSKALKDITLPLYEQRVTALIGPSGCGKSTLLRILNRIYELYPGQRAEGEVMLDGENILDPKLDANLLRSKVGMVFQKPTPFPMTIYDNIAFGVRLYMKPSRAEMDEIVESSLTRTALWNEVKDRLHTSALGLSGGQQQRLCIARTVAIKPEVVLFDEPTSALDPEMIKEVLDTIRSLADDGMTMLIVTHEMGFARQVADRIVFMDEGQIVEINRPEAFFTSPQHERTKRFLSQILHN